MRKNTLLLAAVLTAIAGNAAAQSQTFYVGGAYLQINSKAPALQGGDPVPAPGGLLEVDDSNTLAFGYIRGISDRFSLEAALGIPPKHKTFGKGFLEPFGQISSVKQFAPTVFFNYHFGDPGATLRPFVGLGLNYTRFLDAKSTPSGEAASGGPTKLRLSDSWGLAAHGGAAWAIDKRWQIIGSIAYADVKSNLTATTTTYKGEVVRTTRIEFRPVVYTLVVGYSF